MSAIPIELCLSSAEITDIRVRPGGTWVSGVLSRSNEAHSSSVLAMWSLVGGEMTELLRDPVPTAGRGVSGGAHIWNRQGDVVYVVTRLSGIVKISVGDNGAIDVLSLGCDPSRTWSTPALDNTEKYLFAIADGSEMWRFEIASNEACLDFHTEGFAFDSAAGSHSVCVTWDRPEMPWTQSRIYPEETTPHVSVGQPRFSRSGTNFGYVSDACGVANVAVVADDIVHKTVYITDEFEHAGPTWGPGQRSWCFNSDGTHVAYTRNENGFGSLWVFDRISENRFHIGNGVHGCLSWENNVLAAVRTGARTYSFFTILFQNNKPGFLFGHDATRRTRRSFKVENVFVIGCFQDSFWDFNFI